MSQRAGTEFGPSASKPDYPVGQQLVHHLFNPVTSVEACGCGCSAKCVSGEATGVVVATGAQTVLAQMIREKRWPPRMTPQAECGES